MKKAIISLSAVPGFLMGAGIEKKHQRRPDSLKAPLNYEIYRVKPGDTLYKIAKKKIGKRVGERNAIKSLKFLIDHNKQLKDPNKIQVGEKIYIPSYEKRKEYLVGESDPRDIHIVSAGETLSILAQEWMGLPFFRSNYQGSLQLVISANPQISNPDKIEIGDLVFKPRQIRTFKKQALKFHFPKSFVVIGNQIISTDSKQLKFEPSKYEDEGVLIFHN